MATRRDRQLPPKPKQDKPAEASLAPTKTMESPRKEKLADFLIDVAKYVFTGVVITSLFNDVTDRSFLYLLGMIFVVLTLWAGLMLTDKRKEK